MLINYRYCLAVVIFFAFCWFSFSLQNMSVERLDTEKTYTLTNKESKWLLGLLKDSNLYDNEIKKLCPFVPEYKLIFANNCKSKKILISLSCSQIKLMQKGEKAQILNLSDEFQHLLHDFFQSKNL
ncbi:MAG: hypothetical protein BGO10_02425 [Chlamydia sp. 32-24]|nr:MAG: hypothetical protein BGO10_02425 [Chlamydia sp. 32-24]